MREANRTAGMYLENIRLLWPFSQHSHADCLEVVCASWIPMKDGGEPRWSGQSLQFITSHKVLMQLRLPLFPLFARDRTSHFFFFFATVPGFLQCSHRRICFPVAFQIFPWLDIWSDLYFEKFPLTLASGTWMEAGRWAGGSVVGWARIDRALDMVGGLQRRG